MQTEVQTNDVQEIDANKMQGTNESCTQVMQNKNAKKDVWWNDSNTLKRFKIQGKILDAKKVTNSWKVFKLRSSKLVKIMNDGNLIKKNTIKQNLIK